MSAVVDPKARDVVVNGENARAVGVKARAVHPRERVRAVLVINIAGWDDDVMNASAR